MTLTLFATAAQVAATGQPTGIISLAWLMIAIPAVSSALLLVCGRRSDLNSRFSRGFPRASSR